MINIFLAFIILSIAMYLAIRVLDVINARFNFFPKPDVIRPQTKTEIACGVLDSSRFSVVEFSSINAHQAVKAGEINSGAVASEVVTNAEGLAEGVQASVESVGETLTTLVEGLSHH